MRDKLKSICIQLVRHFLHFQLSWKSFAFHQLEQLSAGRARQRWPKALNNRLINQQPSAINVSFHCSMTWINWLSKCIYFRLSILIFGFCRAEFFRRTARTWPLALEHVCSGSHSRYISESAHIMPICFSAAIAMNMTKIISNNSGWEHVNNRHSDFG